MMNWYGRRKTMAGMTVWSALGIGLMVGGYIFILINLYEPLFERWKIQDIIATTLEDQKTLEKTAGEIKERIFKRMSINGIYGVDPKALKIRKTDKEILIKYNKDAVVIFPGNVSVTVHTHYDTRVKRPEL